MKHFEKGTLKRIILKNLLTLNKKLLFEIVDYLSEFDIPKIKDCVMYDKEYIIEEMDYILKNKGFFALIDCIDYNNFKSRHSFFNYNHEGKIYSMSEYDYFKRLLSCIDIIIDEIIKDPELLEL